MGGDWPGEGNLFLDPLFCDPHQGDFRLRSIACGFDGQSPAIDAADPSNRDNELDCDAGLGTRWADQGAYGGGTCGLEIATAPDPLLAFRGSPLLASVGVSNTCNDTLAFDRVLIELIPGSVTMTLYSGPEVSLEPGASEQRPLETVVPAGAPIGVHHARLKLLHRDSEVAFDDRVAVIRDDAALRIEVPQEVASIGRAIELTLDGDTIVVAAGSYYEHSIRFVGRAITVRGEDLTSENVVATTVVDALGSGSVFIFDHAEDSNSVLAGLTITGGLSARGGGIRSSASPLIEHCVIRGNWATSQDSARFESAQGGGIYCGEGAPTFRDCQIIDNGIRLEDPDSVGGGGGVYCLRSAPHFEHCRIERNRAESIGPGTIGGGGIACVWDSEALFVGCAIEDNRIIGDEEGSGSLAWGGGLYISGAEADLTDCTLSSNRIDRFGLALGAGLHLSGQDPGSVVLNGCLLEENVASARYRALGGGPYAEWQRVELIDCDVIHNAAFGEPAGHGGGTYTSNVELLAERTELRGNVCSDCGGGAWIEGGEARLAGLSVIRNRAYRGGGVHLRSSIELENSTFTGNQAAEKGDGIYVATGEPSLAGCILWGDGAEEIFVYEDEPSVSYSIIEGGWPGEGNLDQDPLFRSPSDPRLQARECGWSLDSPAIDAAAPWLKDRALGCEAGLGGEWADMGAFGGLGALRAAALPTVDPPIE